MFLLADSFDKPLNCNGRKSRMYTPQKNIGIKNSTNANEGNIWHLKFKGDFNEAQIRITNEEP